MKRSPTSTTNTYDRYELAPRRSLYHHHTGELFMKLDLAKLSHLATGMGQVVSQGIQRGDRWRINRCGKHALETICTEIEANL